MIWFVYHRGYETGVTLGKSLKQKLGKKFIALKGFRLIKRQNIKPGDFLVRWGTTRNKEKDDMFLSRGAEILNPADSILRNTNKLRSLKLFKEAGLNVAKIFTDKYSIDRFPVLGRDRNHHGGLDIVIVKGNNILELNNFDKIPDKDFYVEYIPSSAEYRVHVFNNRVARVTKKVFRGHDREGNEISEKMMIKNDTYGWGHQHIEMEEFSKEFQEAALKAVRAIGLGFGAVDLLISAVNGKPYILEVNSCPRLNSIGLDIYTEMISSLVD